MYFNEFYNKYSFNHTVFKRMKELKFIYYLTRNPWINQKYIPVSLWTMPKLCYRVYFCYFQTNRSCRTALHYARKAFQSNPSFIINSWLVTLANLAILSILIKCTSGKINCQLASQGGGVGAAAIVMVMDKTQSSENYSNFNAYRKAHCSAESQFAALANPKG